MFKRKSSTSDRYKFLGRKKILWFIISGIIIIPGIISLFTWKLPLGIDFRGGSLMELKFETQVKQADLETKLLSYEGVQGLTITTSEGDSYLIKMLPIEDSVHTKILENIKTDLGAVTEKQYQSVGPSVSSDLTKKAVIAVVLASFLILCYLAYAFRKVAQPISAWRFGSTAIFALVHDLIITVGVFSILAHYFNYEVDSSFITALLTVMGFSVHDTIVVFDRLRENLTKHRTDSGDEFEEVADKSLGQTLNRSLATSLTVIFTLSALAALGGTSIRPFVLTLLIGIAVGTYSSIFTATPLLVVWQRNIFKKLKH